ncbi:hypothetical protein E2C01_095557 [Portunus trituberculatus]|uniref:Uncharacterized protein n=1 Tax=Portunus trituberculatus TaxID=210409 RepID=A0A5B7K0H9_PORTR|nr:hypothetical protein [Portunus trituberculatus]
MFILFFYAFRRLTLGDVAMARCCQPSSPPLLLSLLLFSAVAVSRAQYPEDFGLERTSNPVSISRLEVMCGKDHLTVQLAFTAPFRVRD